MLQRRRLQEEGQQEEKERAHQALGKAMAPRLSPLAPCATTSIQNARAPSLAAVGCAPCPRVLPPNHTHPVNAASEGREGGQGVAVVDVGWRFNLTWGAPVRGTARGAAVWLPGSNTTLLQRTSNLLCREEVLPAVVPVEEEGEEEEEEGEDEKKEGGRPTSGPCRPPPQPGRSCRLRVNWSQRHSWPTCAGRHCWQSCAPSRSQLHTHPVPLRRSSSCALPCPAISLAAPFNPVAAATCMHAEPLSPATACPHAADCRDAAAEEAVAAASGAVAATTAAATAGTEAGAATMPAAPPSASAVPTSVSGQPSIPWLRLLDAFPLSLMRPDTHVVAFHPLPNALPLPHPFTSEKPLLPHEAVNGSVVGRGGGGAGGVRVGGMTRDCVHWCLPGVPDTWNELLYADLLQSDLLRAT
ncbi:unnamed protein product [Closterium sp. NIES-64]|nr:unnamed protein product [Closterium sp. NIES-64]